MELAKIFVSGEAAELLAEKGREMLLEEVVGELSEAVTSPVEFGRGVILQSLGGAKSPIGRILSELFKAGDEGGGAEKADAKKKLEQIMDALEKSASPGKSNASHLEWLKENGWRFNWRSQPRILKGSRGAGEWMKGRLDHPVDEPLVSRRNQRIGTRSIRAYRKRMRAIGHTRFRPIVSSWGKTL